jgi:BirA family biotin operon repressor/biotin-[acetyl-CoA-carboxylase] ligase
MCNAVESVSGYRPQIKWINDLIAQGKKLGGILTELSADPKSGLVHYAVIGIGINCSQTREDFPREICDTAISLESVTSMPISRYELATAMIRALKEMDADLLTNQSAMIAAYRKDCMTLGREVILLRGDEQLSATALDIENDGALLVKLSDGRYERVQSGEARVRGVDGYI